MFEYQLAVNEDPQTPALDDDEEPTPEIIVEILEKLEDHFGRPASTSQCTSAQPADPLGLTQGRSP